MSHLGEIMFFVVVVVVVLKFLLPVLQTAYGSKTMEQPVIVVWGF